MLKRQNNASKYQLLLWLILAMLKDLPGLDRRIQYLVFLPIFVPCGCDVGESRTSGVVVSCRQAAVDAGISISGSGLGRIVAQIPSDKVHWIRIESGHSELVFIIGTWKTSASGGVVNVAEFRSELLAFAGREGMILLEEPNLDQRWKDEWARFEVGHSLSYSESVFRIRASDSPNGQSLSIFVNPQRGEFVVRFLQ